jgi:hypothetical protein
MFACSPSTAGLRMRDADTSLAVIRIAITSSIRCRGG